MSYASVADVEAVMGAEVAVPRCTALLDLAAGIIDSYQPAIAGMQPVPPAARTVNTNMVVRVLANPMGVKSEQLASYSTTYGSAVAGMVLTDEDMSALDDIGGPGVRVYSVRTTGVGLPRLNADEAFLRDVPMFPVVPVPIRSPLGW